MKPTFLSKVFQAALMCCLAVILSGCDDFLANSDNPTGTILIMNTSDATLKVGEQLDRPAITNSPAYVLYSSSDPAVATVGLTGTVTAIAPGTATITANVQAVGNYAAASASYKVTVEGTSSSSTSDPMKSTPLTFEAAVAGAKVTFTINVATGVEYSTDGVNWSPYTSATPITLAAIGDKVSFRGTNAAYSDGGSISNISCDNDCYIYGNIMSLIKKEDFENVTTFTENNTFRRLFENNANIKNHTDATKYLVLPATKMTANCYRNMFYKCAGLTTTPVINVDCDGKASCMERMFFNCTGLTKVAEGSKISGNMGSYSCSEMFSGCSNLESVPSDLLPSTSLATSCYYCMFQTCAKLEKAPKLPAETLKIYCYLSMFDGCTDLNEAWVKANYTIANNECLGMFDGCATGGTLHTDGTGWAAGTNLPTGWTTIAYNALAKSTPFTIEAMEAGATVTFKALNSAPARDIQYSTDGGATWSDGNTGGTGVSVVLAKAGDKVSFRGENTNYATSGNNDYSHIDCDKNIKVYGNIMSLIQKTGFETVTALTAVHAFRRLFKDNVKLIDASDLLLPATTLTNYCYAYMFYGCANLTAAPKEMPATTVADDCYGCMFQGCTELTTVPVELPATEMKEYCYSSMFYGCSKLTTAPKLPATTLVNRCYGMMFYNCTKLAEAWVKAGYNSGACYQMFNGCTNASTSTFHTDGDWSAWKTAFANIDTWTYATYTPAP